jgi:Fic-DOC domain mobile mystery protein B
MNSLPGTTPLSPDEQKGLIPSLVTQDELNQWERENIIAARAWALSRRRLQSSDLFTEAYVRELHRRMFSETWKWAGAYRRGAKNLGVPAHEIRDRIALLLGNVQFWIEHHTYDVDEIAVRGHHQLVVIHPFANGNGRHARLYADVIAAKFGRDEFSWGRETMIAAGTVREAYLQALRAADRHEMLELLKFARS